MTSMERDKLFADCEIATKCWRRMFSGITALTDREKGEEAIAEL